MAVWVVVGVIGVGAIAAAYASRRHSADVEPTVREFAEFRDALSQQVAASAPIPGALTNTPSAHRTLAWVTADS